MSQTIPLFRVTIEVSEAVEDGNNSSKEDAAAIVPIHTHAYSSGVSGPNVDIDLSVAFGIVILAICLMDAFSVTL